MKTLQNLNQTTRKDLQCENVCLTESGAAGQPSLNVPAGLQPRQVRHRKTPPLAAAHTWIQIRQILG